MNIYEFFQILINALGVSIKLAQVNSAQARDLQIKMQKLLQNYNEKYTHKNNEFLTKFKKDILDKYKLNIIEPESITNIRQQQSQETQSIAVLGRDIWLEYEKLLNIDDNEISQYLGDEHRRDDYKKDVTECLFMLQSILGESLKDMRKLTTNILQLLAQVEGPRIKLQQDTSILASKIKMAFTLALELEPNAGPYAISSGLMNKWIDSEEEITALYTQKVSVTRSAAVRVRAGEQELVEKNKEIQQKEDEIAELKIQVNTLSIAVSRMGSAATSRQGSPVRRSLDSMMPKGVIVTQMLDNGVGVAADFANGDNFPMLKTSRPPSPPTFTENSLFKQPAAPSKTRTFASELDKLRKSLNTPYGSEGDGGPKFKVAKALIEFCKDQMASAEEQELAKKLLYNLLRQKNSKCTIDIFSEVLANTIWGNGKLPATIREALPEAEEVNGDDLIDKEIMVFDQLYRAKILIHDQSGVAEFSKLRLGFSANKINGDIKRVSGVR